MFGALLIMFGDALAGAWAGVLGMVKMESRDPYRWSKKPLQMVKGVLADGKRIPYRWLKEILRWQHEPLQEAEWVLHWTIVTRSSR